MKKCFTTQRSANRHPKKYNFNYIETLSVENRRRLGYDVKAQLKRDENGELVYETDKNGNKTDKVVIEIVRTNDSIRYDEERAEREKRKAERTKQE